jgi:tRNA modification GTPase
MALPGSDTIAAIATPPGRGGIGVLRLSGPESASIATRIAGALPEPRIAAYRRFLDASAELIDHGLVLHFARPSSFTGEDVVELHAHGGPVVLDMLLERATQLGARLARPGEFSERAFLNGKLDLAQAEAVADLIDSGSREAARGALRSLEGEFSRRIEGLLEELTTLRVFVEACIDFPEEEIDFLRDSDVLQRLQNVLARCEAVKREARQGTLLREGLRVVLAGRPNAGKSSLLNILAGRDVAIVSAIPGTTRDVLREEISLDGMPLHLIDTAGLRDSPDEIEQEGIRRTLRETEQADHVLLVIDGCSGDTPDEVLSSVMATVPATLPPMTVLLNKSDLSGMTAGEVPGTSYPTFAVSARTGAGLAALFEHLKRCAGMGTGESSRFSARRRHLDALERCLNATESALAACRDGVSPELMAEDLREAQCALGEITGAVSSDALLGKIFASFCIGK